MFCFNRPDFSGRHQPNNNNNNKKLNFNFSYFSDNDDENHQHHQYGSTLMDLDYGGGAAPDHSDDEFEDDDDFDFDLFEHEDMDHLYTQQLRQQSQQHQHQQQQQQVVQNNHYPSMVVDMIPTTRETIAATGDRTLFGAKNSSITAAVGMNRSNQTLAPPSVFPNETIAAFSTTTTTITPPPPPPPSSTATAGNPHPSHIQRLRAKINLHKRWRSVDLDHSSLNTTTTTNTTPNTPTTTSTTTNNVNTSNNNNHHHGNIGVATVVQSRVRNVLHGHLPLIHSSSDLFPSHSNNHHNNNNNQNNNQNIPLHSSNNNNNNSRRLQPIQYSLTATQLLPNIVSSPKRQQQTPRRKVSDPSYFSTKRRRFKASFSPPGANEDLFDEVVSTTITNNGHSRHEESMKHVNDGPPASLSSSPSNVQSMNEEQQQKQKQQMQQQKKAPPLQQTSPMKKKKRKLDDLFAQSAQFKKHNSKSVKSSESQRYAGQVKGLLKTQFDSIMNNHAKDKLRQVSIFVPHRTQGVHRVKLMAPQNVFMRSLVRDALQRYTIETNMQPINDSPSSYALHAAEESGCIDYEYPKIDINLDSIILSKLPITRFVIAPIDNYLSVNRLFYERNEIPKLNFIQDIRIRVVLSCDGATRELYQVFAPDMLVRDIEKFIRRKLLLAEASKTDSNLNEEKEGVVQQQQRQPENNDASPKKDKAQPEQYSVEVQLGDSNTPNRSNITKVIGRRSMKELRSNVSIFASVHVTDNSQDVVSDIGRASPNRADIKQKREKDMRFYIPTFMPTEYREYSVIKINKYGRRQERIFAIDDKKIYNKLPYNHAAYNFLGLPAKTRRPERPIETLLSVTTNSLKPLSFTTVFDDETLYWEAGTIVEMNEIVNTLNNLMWLCDRKRREATHHTDDAHDTHSVLTSGIHSKLKNSPDATGL